MRGATPEITRRVNSTVYIQFAVKTLQKNCLKTLNCCKRKSKRKVYFVCKSCQWENTQLYYLPQGFFAAFRKFFSVSLNFPTSFDSEDFGVAVKKMFGDLLE